MRNIIVAIVVFLSFGMFSCDEIPQQIDTSKTLDSTYVVAAVPAKQEKNVLVEEYTGAACSNCRAGHEELANLITSSDGRVITIGMHVLDAFSDPSRYGDKFLDLRPVDSTLDMSVVLGTPTSAPQAVVDRKIFDAEDQLSLGLNKWSGYINQQLDSAITRVNVDLNIVEFDTLTGEVIFETVVTCTEAISENIALSIILTEDKIKTKQLDGSTWLDNYYQPHVLRQYFTPVIGKSLNADLVAGRAFFSRFSETVSTDFNPKKLELIAVVHYAGDDDLDYQVIQSQGEYLIAR